MAQSNIVFLIDINGIPKESPPPAVPDSSQEKKPVLEGGGDAQNESTELFPSKEDPSTTAGGEVPTSSSSSLDEVLTWLKEFVLVTLFKEANAGGNYDFSRVQWSFKFFDSSHHVDFRDCRSFFPFDNESFSNFESQLSLRLKPGVNTSTAVTSYDSNPRVKFLSDAIKVITGSLPWAEAPLLNFSKSFNAEDEPITKNTVYAFLRVPRDTLQLEDFSDLQAKSATKDFMAVLLPSAFSSIFHHKLRIQLNFVDLTTPSWSGSYPRQIVKCLQYLGNGQILSVPHPGITSVSTSSLSLGLIPYTTHLRQCLQQSSTQNENIPSHIQKLAPSKALTKISQKISPDFAGDTDSVARSLRSGPASASVLEASFNIQHNHPHRVLRPFRPSSAHYDEDDRYEFVRQHKQAQDRMMREGDRKRKRYEYDDSHDDYYGGGGGNMRRYGYVDDDDSVEIDSQCGKEQRLENWVNEGVFTAKRKRHPMEAPPTKAVPMSRPGGGLSKSFHVFHEPAPRNFRGKKMLQTVERNMFKSAVVEQQKRRSSGGGADLQDFKRITQKQEKELSAIKRRLKAFLEGELDDQEGDPLAWKRKLKVELRKFADMILEEPDSCLVALAQALVNSASVKFTPQKVQEIGEEMGKSVTRKDLLEHLLLLEQTSLNMNIISAQKKARENTSPAYQKQKIFTFRQTELQIILRLEIAWCFGIERDEDAMEDLLVDVVSLLQVISAYRTKPPIDVFVNTILLPTYSQSNRFMRDLYKKMNLPLPTQLVMDGSPVPSSSRRDDDSSIISSTSSANLYPEDSASQLHLHNHKRRRPSPSVHRRASLPVHQPARKAVTVSKKLKQRHIMVQSTSTNPKLPAPAPFMVERTDSQKKSGNKVSPKRVRRNLFDVQKSDKKDSKTLMALATSRISKSPAFKSPRGKSPLSPSGFFRAARSRRNLVMSMSLPANDPQFGSPNANNHVLCPESPATPGGALSVTSKYAPTSTSGSTEKPRIIQESPEVQKNEYDNRPMGRVASLSFYSTAAPKSRAWEKSETQLMAARIKESVDLRSKELTLSDFEQLPESPDTKPRPTSGLSESVSVETPMSNFSFVADSYTERHPVSSPIASSSSALIPFIPHTTGPAHDLDNPRIEALINRPNPLYPLLSSSTCDETQIVLKCTQTDPYAPKPDISSPPRNPQTGPTSGSSPLSNNLQTPSKRVQFNLNENLVNTPSRRASTGTPKSILKETHDTTL